MSHTAYVARLPKVELHSNLIGACSVDVRQLPAARSPCRTPPSDLRRLKLRCRPDPALYLNTRIPVPADAPPASPSCSTPVPVSAG